MNTAALSLLCILLFVYLGASQARKELPPDFYVDVDKNDPTIKDLVDFAAGEMGLKLISVGRVGKKTVKFNNIIFKTE